jgi:hypothetical protein
MARSVRRSAAGGRRLTAGVASITIASIAFWVLTLAVAAGAVLALWHLRATDGPPPPPRAAGIAHGVVGAAGIAALVLALQGPARGVATGVGSFGVEAAVLFAGALLTGVVLLFRRKGSVMAIHAGIAITGYVLLLAWQALG